MSFPVVNGVEVAVAPPAGYQVDFGNPETDGSMVRNAYWIFGMEFAFATAFLGQRMYTNGVILRKFMIDDYLILFAWVLSIAAQSFLLDAYRRKLLGVHAWEMPVDSNTESALLVMCTTLTYIPTTILSKLTLCFFYYRLSPARWYQYSVYVTGIICTTSLVGIWFSVLFACKPIAAGWDVRLSANATCINRPPIYITQAAFGCITDVMLLILPIPTVLGLQMSTRQKFGVLGLFAIGSITLVTSVVRLVLLLPSVSNPDQSWSLAEGCLWVIIEANLLIMCGSLPTLRVFLKNVAPRVLGDKSQSKPSEQNSASASFGLRTFGGSNGPRRKFDTLVELEHDNIIGVAQYQRPTSNHVSKTSRLHYLIPASEPTLNLCANIISVLANRYPVPSIIGYKGKDEFDAKVAHIAKLHSISRYLNGPAGEYSDDLVIVADGHDVLAQLPAEVLIHRYFEIMERHDRVLADQFGLSIAQAHEQGLRKTLLWGADKYCFPRERDEPQCWAVPESFLSHNVYGKHTQDRSMRYADPRHLNSGTVIGPLGDLRDCIDAALILIENTWNATFNHRNSDQFYLGKLYARQEVNHTMAITGGRIPNLKGTRKLPQFSGFGTEQTDYHMAVDHESAFTCTQCANVDWMRNIAFDRPGHRSVVKGNSSKKKHPFKPFTIQMPGLVVNALTKLYDAIDHEQPTEEWIKSVQLGTNIATGHIYPLYHGTCRKSNFMSRYMDLWLYPMSRRLLGAASKALEAKEPLTGGMVDGRYWVSSQHYPHDEDGLQGLGGIYTDAEDNMESFIPLTEFCDGYLEELLL
ncbi:hypothetical protein FPSE_12408 [Fusarium pseudograminearum CS3096]|uniref:Rhodopsin domain-containing protein n=1 Tax=Fusarium pseudograminearum (strain CS3096) TaxID=1028729 RepID=K3V6T1_FUSPC|nr:hypothetical protein FPSE_12408 [Fusarium pseudograminearum CS3096]EKJ67423.1 hypothetical protein FPSE_12408 [Fusarium pseudograminearum CS3096]